MTVYIGDVHGKYKQYKRIMQQCTNSIQVGDMGVGFRRTRGYRVGDFAHNPPHYAMKRGGHRFIRGNHDNPYECRKHSQCIADGSIEGDTMYVGGALSVDRQWRQEDFDWWANEELSTGQLDDIVGLYIKAQPSTMVTHDCPESIAHWMAAVSGRNKLDYPSRTRQAFESMLYHHKPKLWIFGHWHHSFDKVIEGTRFVCLAELEAKEIHP